MSLWSNWACGDWRPACLWFVWDVVTINHSSLLTQSVWRWGLECVPTGHLVGGNTVNTSPQYMISITAAVVITRLNKNGIFITVHSLQITNYYFQVHNWSVDSFNKSNASSMGWVFTRCLWECVGPVFVSPLLLLSQELSWVSTLEDASELEDWLTAYTLSYLLSLWVAPLWLCDSVFLVMNS